MTEQKLLKRRKKAEKEGNRNVLADACLDLAELYYEKQQYHNAIDEYTTASDIYKNQTGKQLDYARTNRRIAEAFTGLKEYNKALDCQQIYLNIAKEQGDKLEQQRALATMGHIYLNRYADDETDRDSLNLAYKAFIKSFVLCEELENVVNQYEHKDMMSRLLGNLGVVCESLGNYEKGINLLLKSINICKAHDLYEQLQRSHTCLASLYCTKGDYNNAIEQYNIAMDVAGRLKNKIALKYECLKNKADILIKLADFSGAKAILMKAYKLKQFSKDKIDVEQKLKVVAALCYTEDSLLTTSDSDYHTKKCLYEKLGDGACLVNNFSSAIKYYKKMLEAAIDNGEADAELSPCYFSIAESYRDNKQYDLAIKYYKKDYEVINSNSKDRIKVLLNIIDCMESNDGDIEEIEKNYDQARSLSLAIGDKNCQYRVLMRHITFLRNEGRLSQATQLENSLKDLNMEELSDNEPASEELAINIGDEISIKDITDVSSDSDADSNNINRPRTSRKRTKGFIIKKNIKGETQLHTACIAGNLELVRRLLEQGHSINVRDNCGWLPIHEACICGHLEIVKMLIENGAWINDRGGKLCDGVTPLHDAASNGHLQIIQLLLDGGASAIAKTNGGVMPLQMLEQWCETDELDSESIKLYATIKSRLTQDMEKLGHSRNITKDGDESKAFVYEATDEVQPAITNKSFITRNESVVGRLRRNISCDTDLDDNREISDDSELSNDAGTNDLLINADPLENRRNVKDDYIKVIQNLRHPLREDNLEKKRKSSENHQPALIEANNVVEDDWLENDLPMKHKRHKLSASSFSPLRRHSSSHSIKSNKSDCENWVDLLESEMDTNYVTNLPNLLATENNITKRKTTQSSLFEQGFTRHCSFSSTNNRKINRKQKHHQTKITSFGYSVSPTDFEIVPESNYISSGHQITSSFNAEQTVSIDVRIDNKLYRVPVRVSELHFRTIRWLSDEAADRYSRKESVKPTLELETKNGASLAEDDYLNILFNVGNMQAEEVEAKIVKWNLPSLADRYIEACASLGVGANCAVSKILQDTSTSINIASMGLGQQLIMPLCKAINRQINLQNLNLSDNFMRDDSLQLLCLSLPSLDNLAVLNLSNNELTNQGLKFLADSFVQSQKPLLTNLISLDLSYNPLGDDCLKSLSVLTRYLKLQILDLVDVGLSQNIFTNVSNRNIDLCLEYITNINISYNKLNRQQILTILSWINPLNCEELNISSNNVMEQGLLKDIVHWLESKDSESLKLRSLNISRCRTTDLELHELSRLMPRLTSFNFLDISYNEHLSSNALSILLKYPLKIHLIGCENVLNFEVDQTSINIKELIVSFNSNNHSVNNLINMFKNIYHERLKLHESKDYLKVSLI